MSRRGIRICFLVNLVGLFLTVLFWLAVALRIYIRPVPGLNLSQDALGSTLGFLVADMIVAAVVLAIAAYGLFRLKFIGWLAAQMANILWIYSMLNLWVRDIFTGHFAPGLFLFTPFAFFSIWAIFFLWRQRHSFV